MENQNNSVETTQVEGTENTQISVNDVVSVEYEAAENLLRAKYPHLQIVPGSLRQDANHPKFSNKRRVLVICPVSGALCERATSDLHTFQGSPEVMKRIRKANKAKKRALAKIAADAGDDAGDDGDE